MISENLKRDWIEVGVHATLAKVYWVVTVTLVVNLTITGVAFIFFPSLTAIGTLFMGITVGMLIFMIVTACTVKADKISRKWA